MIYQSNRHNIINIANTTTFKEKTMRSTGSREIK